METNSLKNHILSTEINKEENIKGHMITVYVLYSTLSLINIAYLTTRVLKLKQKKFHLVMFAILQLCYCSRIADRYIWNRKTIADCFWVTYYTSDEVAHCFFAIKYWALSRKISLLVNRREDK